MTGAKRTTRAAEVEQAGEGAMRSAVAPYTRRELVLLGIVVALGALARVLAVSQSAVEHFDEGVYASNIYFGGPDYAYPQQRFYAPPLLPALIEAGMIAGLPPNLAALLPGFLAGCGTIAALWWLGRSWFGPEVGLAAAALAAWNDYHVTFSAAALTDVLLGLWLVLAVDAIARSLANRDIRWAIGGGIYTGLAWWTKYNGWLPLAIEAAALPVLWFFLRPPGKQIQSWLACFAVTALVAAAIWSPYYFSLQSQGGYGPIAENHAKYVVGFAGWFHSAARQVANQLAIGTAWSFLGLALALLVPQLLRVPQSGAATLWLIGKCLLTAFALLVISVTLAVGLGAAIGIGRMLLAMRRAPRADAIWRMCAIGLCLVSIWWAALLVATPLYTPYPRLIMPGLLAAILACALNWHPLLATEGDATPYHAGSLAGCSIFGLMLVYWLGIYLLCPHTDHLERLLDRRGLLGIAEEIHASQPQAGSRVMYVYGEPALYFQLRAAGEEIVSAVQQLPAEAATIDGKAIPTYLIAGPHAQRDPEFVRQFGAAQERWQLYKEYDYQPSALVWLDMNDPRRSPKETADKDRVRLYRLRP
jgi:dolichyl-phosphate-mannose-protein mannosyltransferase